MPTCRNCGARLSKFDKDICPVCGTPDPLKGVTSETVEITSQVDLSQDPQSPKLKIRSTSFYDDERFFVLLGIRLNPLGK